MIAAAKPEPVIEIVNPNAGVLQEAVDALAFFLLNLVEQQPKGN